MIAKPRLTLIAGPVAMLVLIVSSGWVLWSSFERSKEAGKSVEHTYNVLIASESFLSTLREVESTVRAYVLVHDRKFVPPYRQAVAAQAEKFNELERLTGGNAKQQAALKQIRELTNQRLAVLEQAEQETSRSRSDIISVVPLGKGPKLMSDLTAKVREFEAEERRLLALRTTAAQDAETLARIMLILTSSLLAIVLLFAGAAVERYVRTREASLEALQRQADLIDFSHDAVVTLDPAGVITGWNAGAVEVYGWTSGEALGRHSQEILKTVAGVKEALAATGRWDGELAQTTKEGHTCLVESRYVLVRNRVGEPVGVLNISRDETLRKRAEDQYRQTAEQRRLALDSAQLGFWDYDVKLDRVMWDERCREILGLRGLGPASFEQAMKLVHPEEQQQIRAAAGFAMSSQGDGRFAHQMRVQLRNGPVRWLATHGRVYFDEAGKPIRVIGVNGDITEQKQVQHRLTEALAESDRERRRLGAILETMPAGVVLADRANVLIEANVEAVNIWRAGDFATLRQRLAELKGWRAGTGEPMRLEDWPRTRALRGETVLGEIVDVERFDGSRGTVFNSASPVKDAQGSIDGAVGVMVDITAQRQIELALRKSEENLAKMLEQKNILFQEVQHRVKNNLQIVSSLLSLEAQRYQDTAFHNALNESRDRIRSMALMHEKFYHFDDLARIEFSDYVEELARYFFSSYIADPSSIEFTSEVDVRLKMAEAIPCGLILQELLSNSVKYAFPQGAGAIKVTFHDGKLCYWDSGPGLPGTVDLSNPGTLGLQLVTDLASQLQGKIEYEYNRGSQFTLTFGG